MQVSKRMPERNACCKTGDPAPPPKVFISMLSVCIRLPLFRRTEKANEGIRWDIIEENGVYVWERLNWLMVGTAQRLVLSTQIRQCARTAVMLLWCPCRQTFDSVCLLISHKNIINAQHYHLNKEHTQILRFTFDLDSIQDWTDRSTLANVSTLFGS